jgi:chromosome segregation ATPase
MKDDIQAFNEMVNGKIGAMREEIAALQAACQEKDKQIAAEKDRGDKLAARLVYLDAKDASYLIEIADLRAAIMEKNERIHGLERKL